MSASTRTYQQPLGTYFGAALAVIGMVIILAAVLALSQVAPAKSQTAPAPGAAPAFIDHGSRDELGTSGLAGAAPSFIDHGSRDEIGKSPVVKSNYMSAAAAAAAAKAPVGNDHGLSNRSRLGTGGSTGPRLRPQ
jgi:predicted alpha/beta-hydrolase family hydrolase